MKDIKAIIFDLDGLMFDTERMNLSLINKLGATYGIRMSEDDYAKLLGLGPESMEFINKEFPYFLRLGFSDEKRTEYIREYFKKPGDANKEGLRELYEYARKRYKIAIGSNSAMTFIRSMLDYSGFSMDFDFILGGDMGIKSKPEPDIYLTIAKKLGVRPENCIVLEDSKTGLMAAKRANMLSVFIEDMVHYNSEIEEYMQYQCKSLNEVINILRSLR